MKNRQRWNRSVLAVATLVVLGACTGDDGGQASLDLGSTTTTTAASATSAPATTVTPPTTPATTAPATPPTTRPAPVFVDGVPQVTAAPLRAAAGARVRIQGSGFNEAEWRAAGNPLWLTRSGGGCAFYADAEHTVQVSADGFLSGEFVVPGRGICRMSTSEDVVVTPGTYQLVFQCTACRVGQFEVTASPSPPSVQCQTVGFTPNSEDAAGSIVATNVACAEAEAMVRKVGTMVGVLNGPTRAEADGFVCQRTSSLEEPLPRASYLCTSGTKRVTFVRS
jgi:hypothetical protein